MVTVNELTPWEGHKLGDFYYANSEMINETPWNSINHYHFQNKILQNQGTFTFRSFVKGIKYNSFLMDMETSVINMRKVKLVEVKLVEKKIIFHFDNGITFTCNPPVNLADGRKLQFLSFILKDLVAKSIVYH